jgi:hypothetical protein
MHKSALTSSKKLLPLIESYFRYIEGEYYFEKTQVNQSEDKTYAEKKIYTRQPEPATITGFALFLGFNSKQEFDEYELKGRFANIIKRGRLRIEALYEQKLHQPAPTGAIFALKTMGWKEKQESKKTGNGIVKKMEVHINETGPKPAENEKEVVL